MKALFRSHRADFLLACLLFLVAIFLFRGTYPLYYEEPRRALIALEFLLSNNWLQPTLFGEDYFRKPPLYNWFLAVVFKILGTGNFQVRLISGISLLALGVEIFLFFKHFFGKRIALYSAIIFCCSADLLFFYSRLAEMDLFYAALIFPLIVMPYFFLVKNENWLYYLAPPLVGGLSLLAKGFPAIAFCGISMLFAPVLLKRWSRLFDWRILLSVLCFISLPLLYYSAYFKTITPDLWWQTMINESAGRTLTGEGIWPYLSHMLSFPLINLKDLLPFSLLLLLFRKSILQKPHLKAFLLLFLSQYLLYWLSPGARSRYVYMLYPFAALLLAYLYGENEKCLERISIIPLLNRTTLIFLTLVCMGLGIYTGLNLKTWVVVVLASVSTVFLMFRTEKPLWGIAILMIFIRIGINISFAQPEVINELPQQNEVNLADEVHKEVGNAPLYYNLLAEWHYTFCFELSRLRMKQLTRDREFQNPGAYYIISAKENPANGQHIMDLNFKKSRRKLIWLEND